MDEKCNLKYNERSTVTNFTPLLVVSNHIIEHRQPLIMVLTQNLIVVLITDNTFFLLSQIVAITNSNR